MDALRSWVRLRLGYRSPIYILMSRTLFLYYALFRGGVAGMRLVGMRERSGPGEWMRFRGLLLPIFVRPGTADIDSIVDNIFREEYGQFPAGFEPRTIIDAGAYIGDTSAYFLSRFKSARLIALEPNPESFELAKQNLAGYLGRVELKQQALWDVEGVVNIAGQETGTFVSETGLPVRTTTVPLLMAEFGEERVDLIKMDIEGAELTVLRAGVGGWLGLVNVLLLETHGDEIRDAVLPLIESEGFRIQRHRNVWYCFNQRSSQSA